MTTQIFVVFADYGVEGKGEPIKAFSSERMAALFISGNIYSSPEMVIKPMQLERPSDLQNNLGRPRIHPDRKAYKAQKEKERRDRLRAEKEAMK